MKKFLIISLPAIFIFLGGFFALNSYFARNLVIEMDNQTASVLSVNIESTPKVKAEGSKILIYASVLYL